MRGSMVSAGEQPAVSEAEGCSTAEWALIRRGLSGDSSALDELLGPHQPALVGLCYGILGHRQDAEDAVQETFLRALHALASFRGEAAFRSWLFRIAINLCSSRKRAQHHTEPWDEEGDLPASNPLSPEAIALTRLQIGEALKRLLPRQRAILLLREWEGWSLAEI